MIAERMEVSRATWLQERFPEVVGVLVIGGLALTLAELLLMGHTEKKQMLGVVMTAVAMGLTGVGLLVGPAIRKVLAIALLVVAAGGIYGVVEHLEEAAEHREKAQAKESRVVVQLVDFDEGDRERKGEHEEEEHGPPPLAPLSVTGLALMGSLGLMASRR